MFRSNTTSMRNPPIPLLSSSRLQSGLGLVDVLIALLLLSLSLLGAGAATLHAMQAGRSATLQMRAADLTADLAEDLEDTQSVSPALRISEWKLRVATALPMAVATTRIPAASLFGVHVLSARLQWQEPGNAAMELPLPLPQRDDGSDP
jgi:hypothetical protein